MTWSLRKIFDMFPYNHVFIRILKEKVFEEGTVNT